MTGTGTQADPYIVDNFPDFITAVGTSGAYVEFPKNLVETSDTEIVEGKLYVDSTGEPVENPVPAHLADYYENTFVLDANDYAPEGLTDHIVIRSNSLNGCGGMITNLNFIANRYINSNSSNNIIKNINLNNFLTVADRLFYQADMSKCIISTDVEYASEEYLLYNTKLNKCSMYITSRRTTSSTWYLGYQHNINYCRFILNLPNTTLDLASRISSGTNDNNLVQGTAKQLTMPGKYSVVDCNVVNSVSSSGGANDIIIVNSDKVGGSISGSGLKAVTSAQLTDATYLASIGFPIQT